MKNLRKFEAQKLNHSSFYAIKGGMPPETGSTSSICHVDGVIDGDGAVVA